MRRSMIFLLLLSILLAACTPAATPAVTSLEPIDGAVIVDTRLSLGEISPLIYGTNYGPWVALPSMRIEDAQTLARPWFAGRGANGVILTT